MARSFGNYEYRLELPNGKPAYAPSRLGRKIGRDLLSKVRRRFQPDPFYYHLNEGGHVEAIHVHRTKKYFARLDLENFFYSISRNRVVRAIQDLALPRGEHYAKWSTVKNPYAPPNYSLPYGFVQSPILASLVLARSPLGQFLREIDGQVMVSVYVDDIAISGNNRRVLEKTYRKLRRKAVESEFRINETKSCTPNTAVELFNCHLAHMRTVVTDERRGRFYVEARSHQSEAAFEDYCAKISFGNRAA